MFCHAAADFLEADFWPVVDSYPLARFPEVSLLDIAVRNVQNTGNLAPARSRIAQPLESPFALVGVGERKLDYKGDV